MWRPLAEQRRENKNLNIPISTYVCACCTELPQSQPTDAFNVDDSTCQVQQRRAKEQHRHTSSDRFVVRPVHLEPAAAAMVRIVIILIISCVAFCLPCTTTFFLHLELVTACSVLQQCFPDRPYEQQALARPHCAALCLPISVLDV